jgi:hypothetical protein
VLDSGSNVARRAMISYPAEGQVVILDDAYGRVYMLKATNAEFAPGPAATGALLNYYPEHSCHRLQAWSESAEEHEGEEEFERCDASRLLRLLRCRLAWYGLRSVEVGSVRLLTKDALLVDLLHACGTFLCRIEVDPQSGIIKPSASQTLSRLLISEWQAVNGSPRATSLVQ